VGHYIDQHGLRHVLIREEEDGFSIRNRSGGVWSGSCS